MGNMCGCVRGPKEECYVDPKNAPLTPGSKELRGGRRYFQRRKKCKSGEFQAGDSLKSRGGESAQSETRQDSCVYQAPESHEGAAGSDEMEAPRPKLGSINEGVYVGEVPMNFKSRGGVSSACRKRLALVHGGRRLSDTDEGDGDSGSPVAVERNLHGVTRAFSS